MKELRFRSLKELREYADTKSFFKDEPSAFLSQCKTIERFLEAAITKNSNNELEEASVPPCYVFLLQAVDVYQKVDALRKRMSQPSHASHNWWKSRVTTKQYQEAWSGARKNVVRIAECTETLKTMLKSKYEQAAQTRAEAEKAAELASIAASAATENSNEIDAVDEVSAANNSAEVHAQFLALPLPPSAGPSPATGGRTEIPESTNLHPWETTAPIPIVTAPTSNSDLPPWASQPISSEPATTANGDTQLLPLDVMGTMTAQETACTRNGYGGCAVIDPADLYHLIEEQSKGTVLIIDVRPTAEFMTSHIESFGNFHLINIAPTMLAQGCIGQMIEAKIPARKRLDKEKFSSRHTYDYVVLIGAPVENWSHPPTEYQYLIDAMVTYEPEKKLKRPIRCVDGGYAEFNVTYQALCSAVYIPEYKPEEQSVSSGVDLSSLAYGATPTISRFQPAVVTRQEQAAALAAKEKEEREQHARAAAAREREEREREALAAALRKREEQERAAAEAALAAAAESARLRQEQAERAAAALAAARAARQRQEEEQRAAAAAAEAAELQRRAEQAASEEATRRQLEDQARATEAARVAEEQRRVAAEAAMVAAQLQIEEERRAALAAQAAETQRENERRAAEAARIALEQREEQERAAESARQFREEQERLAEQARLRREQEERLMVEARERRVREERLVDQGIQRRTEEEQRNTAVGESASSAASSLGGPPRRAVPTAPKPLQLNGQVLAQQPPVQPPRRSAVIDRSSKPSHALTGRLSASYRQARLRSMDAVSGSIGQGLTGLRNLGNTCFMNSIIQCILAVAPLTKYFVQGRYRQEINRKNPLGHKGVLAEEFGEMVTIMWTQRFRHIAPRYFKSTLGSLCPQFAGTQQQDSQEFCSFLLDGLHEDLNRVLKKEYVEAPNTDGVTDLVAAEAAWAAHKRRDQSAIVDLFQGQFKSTITCQSCHYSSKTFDPFTFLSLPLVGRQAVSIEQCLQAFSRAEVLSGSNKWHCPKCKRDRDAKKTIQIWKLPRVLIVHLKRFYFEGPFRSKLDTHVEFPLENLDMGKHCYGQATRHSRYRLFAVSNHIGDLSGGHYTAYCRSPFNDQWYKFDDSTVTKHNDRVCTRQSYLLFYTSIDFREHVDLF